MEQKEKTLQKNDRPLSKLGPQQLEKKTKGTHRDQLKGTSTPLPPLPGLTWPQVFEDPDPFIFFPEELRPRYRPDPRYLVLIGKL